MGKINIDDINEWMATKEVDFASHYGSGYRKRLTVAVGRREFIVYDHGEVVHRGMQPYAAIEVFENIKPR